MEAKDIIKKRFGSHDRLYSKYDPKIPESAEREYVRLTNGYMKLLKDELERSLPQLKEIYRKELIENDDFRQNQHFDSASTLQLAIEKMFQQMETNLTTSTEGYNLRKRLENMANLTRKLTVKEWKKACKATVGVDIREDYYMGDFYKEGLEQWISDNVDLIKTIPHDTLGRMKEIIYEGYFGGGTTTSMIEAIMKEYQSNRKHAKFIARDQVAKLNGKIQKAQQLDAGITKYKWSTVGDERVRQSHAALDGLVFEWGHPPMNDDGRACEPGEDYGCRCIGRPVFESQTLELPVDGIEKIEVDAPKISDPLLQQTAFDLDSKLESSHGNSSMIERIKRIKDDTKWERDDVLNGAMQYRSKEDCIFYNIFYENFELYDNPISMVHELSHRIDAKEIHSYKDVLFLKAIDKAKVRAKVHQDELVEWFKIGGQYRDNNMLSDIVSALTDGDMNEYLPAGHSKNYWREKHTTALEIFANLSTNDIMEMDKSGDFTKLFSNLISHYRRMVKL